MRVNPYPMFCRIFFKLERQHLDSLGGCVRVMRSDENRDRKDGSDCYAKTIWSRPMPPSTGEKRSVLSTKF